MMNLKSRPCKEGGFFIARACLISSNHQYEKPRAMGSRGVCYF